MRNEKKKVPPSETRYLQRNPIVSFHLPADKRERLRRMASEDGVTIATYVRRFLSDLPVRDDDMKKAMEEGFSEGYDAGYETTRRRYEIRCPCSTCGELIAIEPGSHSHKSVIGALRRNLWGHPECMMRRTRYR
jgi:hypothetical protein